MLCVVCVCSQNRWKASHMHWGNESIASDHKSISIWAVNPTLCRKSCSFRALFVGTGETLNAEHRIVSVWQTNIFLWDSQRRDFCYHRVCLEQRISNELCVRQNPERVVCDIPALLVISYAIKCNFRIYFLLTFLRLHLNNNQTIFGIKLFLILSLHALERQSSSYLSIPVSLSSYSMGIIIYYI